MGTLTLGNNLGSSLTDLLMCDEIVPGSAPSYQICKTLYTLHPIGKKLVDAPIAKAQSQKREISVPDSPEDMVREQFERVWDQMGCDRLIRNAFRLSRIYGLSTLCAMVKDAKPIDPIDYPNLWKEAADLRFNVLDPLNTSGSLVLNQDPNAPNFLKINHVSIGGVPYNIGRCVVTQNEDPMYIDYTTSAFGYTGRSVYQRALLPLKSFIQSMITDDLVVIKSGILIAKMKSPGSIIDNVMEALAGIKRSLIKEARTGNVISVGTDEEIESLDLSNIEGAMSGARKNILENIAVSADMPAKLLNQETFADGFGEGTEDAKAVVEYIDDIRIQMQPLYAFFDKIVQYVAWSPDFYKTVQATFTDLSTVDFNEAFYKWVNSFSANWPSLLREPESEMIKKDAVKLESMIAELTTLLPILDPENKATAVQWTVDNFNSLKHLFPNPLVIDSDLLLKYLEEQNKRSQESHTASIEPKEPAAEKKFGDSSRSNTPLAQALASLPGAMTIRKKERAGAAAQ